MTSIIENGKGKSQNNESFLIDVWNQTSKVFDFENFITNGKSKFIHVGYDKVFFYDPVREIFNKLVNHSHIVLKMSSYSNDVKKDNQLNEYNIIKLIFVSECEYTEQVKLCETLVEVISIFNEEYSLNNDYFEYYINLINNILITQKFTYSLTEKKMLPVEDLNRL